jgi:hypothetical protein
MTIRRLGIQAAALAMAALVTIAMLGGVDHLATSQPPAGLLAQVSHAPAQA